MNERILTGDASMFTPFISKPLISDTMANAAMDALQAAGIDFRMLVAWRDAQDLAEGWREVNADLPEDEPRISFRDYVTGLAEERDARDELAQDFFDGVFQYVDAIQEAK